MSRNELQQHPHPHPQPPPPPPSTSLPTTTAEASTCSAYSSTSPATPPTTWASSSPPIWHGTGSGRFPANPGIGLFIAATFMLSAWPLCWRAVESAPPGLDLERVKTEAIQMSLEFKHTKVLNQRLMGD
ncbi:hypothetical protein CGLO_02428 [Colletotrichum gloeosporioides Cg-14]|uniref:Uncharacterized protein n=1 Tax=Colletotrichum gloeosporioides (strain Cg-14) TaxID=1237896 RepID=T0KP12_COLGC|nr:hypothetical protein CGLO_02428 [Colletotrichum gloeosporioides Cg-14]